MQNHILERDKTKLGSVTVRIKVEERHTSTIVNLQHLFNNAMEILVENHVKKREKLDLVPNIDTI